MPHTLKESLSRLGALSRAEAWSRLAARLSALRRSEAFIRLAARLSALGRSAAFHLGAGLGALRRRVGDRGRLGANPLVWLERLLLAVGVLCLGAVAYAVIDAHWFAYQQGRRFDEAVRARATAGRTAGGGSVAAFGTAGTGGPVPPPAAETDRLEGFRPGGAPGAVSPAAPAPTAPPEPPLPEGSVIGRIEVARVGVSALVLEGVAGSTLRRGVGHIPGTAMPERLGNVGLAGHRDTVFRGLKDIRKGDVITIDTLEGTYHYDVDWAQVVDPQDVGVLAVANRPELTLVTCYPFYYVGSAPERFVVRAHLAGGGPEVEPGKPAPAAPAAPAARHR